MCKYIHICIMYTLLGALTHYYPKPPVQVESRVFVYATEVRLKTLKTLFSSN